MLAGLVLHQAARAASPRLLRKNLADCHAVAIVMFRMLASSPVGLVPWGVGATGFALPVAISASLVYRARRVFKLVMGGQVECANNEPFPALPSLPLLVNRPTLLEIKKTQIESDFVDESASARTCLG